MLGLSYGEVFLLIGATAALIGPKDLPIIAKAAGRLAGRAIGYVQMARGQFESVMQQSQVSQVHKELQDTIAQLEAIRHEIRSISLVNPGPLTRTTDRTEPKPNADSNNLQRIEEQPKPTGPPLKEYTSAGSNLINIHSQAVAFAKLAESASISNEGEEKIAGNLGLLSVLPVSAESAGLLLKPSGETKGSDIILEAIVEAHVAKNAKDFFSQPQNQIPTE